MFGSVHSITVPTGDKSEKLMMCTVPLRGRRFLLALTFLEEDMSDGGPAEGAGGVGRTALSQSPQAGFTEDVGAWVTRVRAEVHVQAHSTYEAFTVPRTSFLLLLLLLLLLLTIAATAAACGALCSVEKGLMLLKDVEKGSIPFKDTDTGSIMIQGLIKVHSLVGRR